MDHCTCMDADTAHNNLFPEVLSSSSASFPWDPMVKNGESA